jgi:hypothetical protein
MRFFPQYTKYFILCIALQFYKMYSHKFIFIVHKLSFINMPKESYTVIIPFYLRNNGKVALFSYYLIDRIEHNKDFN